MNLLKMNNDLWDEPSLTYVGRTRYRLGLGNPWTFKQSRHAMFHCDTLQETLDKYREWFLDKCIKNYLKSGQLWGLTSWEREYMMRVIGLAHDIAFGHCSSLGCWCINVINYKPVSDGEEKCHAEILYKGCLQIIEYWKDRKTCPDV